MGRKGKWRLMSYVLLSEGPCVCVFNSAERDDDDVVDESEIKILLSRMESYYYYC
jgi:hypothetical protein